MSPEDEPKNDARFTLWLPAELLERVKIKAARERRRPNTVIVEAITQHLGEEAREGGAE